MCGIMSAVSTRNVVPILIDGLKRLEYRGYDSAGLAVVNGKMHRVRARGRVAELEARASAAGVSGEIGIAHTRWATHGVPSERNAHPHVSGGISVVHNGIVENHEAIRARLVALGYEFASDTDTEVIAHLVHSHLREGEGLLGAVRRCLAELSGAYAIAVIDEKDPRELVVARYGAPLLLGLGEAENFAASDSAALASVTQRVVYLKDGDCAAVTRSDIRIIDRKGRVAQRPVQGCQHAAAATELGAYRHYMLKEIHEQPAAVARTLDFALQGGLEASIFGPDAERILRGTRNVLILACGTSYHAGMVARYWLESLAGVPTQVEIASEYRYRESAPLPRTLVVTISQSGETADTLAALEHARSMRDRHGLTICNVAESSLARASELCFLTQAGPEIGVASTKAFTAQLAALAVVTICLAKIRGRISAEMEASVLHSLRRLPAALDNVLGTNDEVAAWARKFAQRPHALFLGRGIHYPIALEGALKLKEISYIHAEAYAAGELKHGPLALVDETMPVVAIAPKDGLFEKLKSNLQEVRARGGELHVFADQDTRMEMSDGVHVIRMPDHAGLLSPILHTVPLQLLAYHTALERGNDVDKPRNLAKSVTVE